MSADDLRSQNSENIDKSGDVNCSLGTVPDCGVLFYSGFRVPGFYVAMGTILSVDGRPVKGLTYAEIRELLRGPIGSDARVRMIAGDDVFLDVLVARQAPTPIKPDRDLADIFVRSAELLAESNADTRPTKLLGLVDDCLQAGLAPVAVALVRRALEIADGASIYCLMEAVAHYVSLGLLAEAEECAQVAGQLLLKDTAATYICKSTDEVVYFTNRLVKIGLLDLAERLYLHTLSLVDKKYSDVTTVSVLEPYAQMLIALERQEDALKYLDLIDKEYEYRTDSPTLLWLAESFYKFGQAQKSVNIIERYLKRFHDNYDQSLSRFAEHMYVRYMHALYQESCGDLAASQDSLRNMVARYEEFLGERYSQSEIAECEYIEFLTPSLSELKTYLGRLLLRIDISDQQDQQDQQTALVWLERPTREWSIKRIFDSQQSEEELLEFCRPRISLDYGQEIFGRAWSKLVVLLRSYVIDGQYERAKMLLDELLEIGERQIECAPTLLAVVSNALLPLFFEMLMHGEDLGCQSNEMWQTIDDCLSHHGDAAAGLLKDWAAIYYYQDLPLYADAIWQHAIALSGEEGAEKFDCKKKQEVAEFKNIEQVEAALGTYAVDEKGDCPKAPFRLLEQAGKLYAKSNRHLEAARAYRQAAFNCHRQASSKMDDELVRISLLELAYQQYKQLSNPPGQELSQMAYMLSYATCLSDGDRAVSLLYEAKDVLPEGDINIASIEGRIKQIAPSSYELNQMALRSTVAMAEMEENNNFWQAVSHWRRAARQSVDSGDMDEGLRRYQKCVECWRKIPGTGTQSPLVEEQDYLLLLANADKRQAVEVMMSQIELSLKDRLGEDSYHLLSVHVQMADFRGCLDDFQGCDKIANSVLDKFEKLCASEDFAPERVYFEPSTYIYKIALRYIKNGLAHKESGLVDKGIAYFERVVASVRTIEFEREFFYPYPSAVFQLGRLYLLKGDIVRAEELVRQSIILMREIPSLKFTPIMPALSLHAQLLRQLGREEEAAAVLTGRAEVSPPQAIEDYSQLLS